MWEGVGKKWEGCGSSGKDVGRLWDEVGWLWENVRRSAALLPLMRTPRVPIVD